MPEEEIEPKVEEVLFPGRMITSKESIEKKVGTLPFFTVQKTDSELVLSKVESRNIKKNPFIFYILRFRKDGLSIVYSVAPDTSIGLRRLAVMRDCMSVLASVSEDFEVDRTKFFQYTDSVIDSVLGNLSENFSSLVNKYDALLAEYRELKRENFDLSAANRNLAMQASRLDEENKRLEGELKALQTYSDKSIMVMLQDWIQTHNNSVDVVEFSKTYKVQPPRVEQALDKMVSLGYIKPNE